MMPTCPACGEPAPDRLTIRYRYPRPACIPEAADPWHVHGSRSLRTCGSVACGAAALLAVIDEIISDAAIVFGHMLGHEDVHITGVGRPGDFTWIVSPEDAA
jgi:hypothetical protein